MPLLYDKVDIEIYSLVGNLVVERTDFTVGTGSINLSGLEKGVYIIRIFSNENVEAINKVIVE